MKVLFAMCLVLSIGASVGRAQIQPAPDRSEGHGPYGRLIIRGAILVDGTGAPARGPVDIVLEGDRIAEIVRVEPPGMDMPAEQRPDSAEFEIDAMGMYALPGFIDMHGHLGGEQQGTPAEYVLKLWLGHGITTVREPGSFNGLDWTVEHRDRSERSEITAPRIVPYVSFGQGLDAPITDPANARAWVRDVRHRGAAGIKFFGASPAVLAAALEEAIMVGLRTTMHHAELHVSRMNALRSATLGLDCMEHWYGLPEALFTDRAIQRFSADYNFFDEQSRFGAAGRLWAQAAPPFSKRWNLVLDSLVALDFTIDPTFTIYEASRDLMREVKAEWHEEYTLPGLWEFFRPSRTSHGSFFFDWTTSDEIAWKRNYQLWMTFVNEYKNRGGRVVTGSDSGFIYKLYGFGYVRELELLQEAGFHPLEVIRSATLMGAEALGLDSELGSVEVGKKADLVLVPGNPLSNLKLLYGTGTARLDEDGVVRRVGGVRWTIKDGVAYNAPELLEDVRQMVREARTEAGIESFRQTMESDSP
jgi:imidazolonepropionase-like amidohydrolase